MNVRELIEIMRRRRWILLSVPAVCIALAAAVTFTATPRYTSTVQLFVSAQNANNGDFNNIYQGGLFTQQRVQSYVAIIGSPRVARPIVEGLGLDESPEEVASKLSASTPTNTTLIDVAATDEDPRRAQRIAASAGSAFIAVIRELEAPMDGGSSAVKLSVSRPATYPDGPSSPNKRRNLAIGLFFGAVLAAALALLRERLDTSVKSLEDLETRTGLAPLAVIPLESQATNKLAFGAAAQERRDGRSEAFRQLRTNLRFSAVEQPKSLVVTSAMPAEGKSTVAANLSLALAELGSRVILVDADLRRPMVPKYLGVTPEGPGLTTVLAGDCDLEDALMRVGDEGELLFLRAGGISLNPSAVLSSSQLTALLDRLNSRADMVIFDAPPLLPVSDAAILGARAGTTMLVARFGRSKRHEVKQAVEALERVETNILGIVLNGAPKDEVPSYYGYA